VRKGYDHVLRRDEVLDREDPTRPARSACAAHRHRLRGSREVPPDDCQQPFRPREDIAQILNLGEQLEELSDDLVLLETGQAMQPQVQNRLRLYL
jgi:hypothetical protein